MTPKIYGFHTGCGIQVYVINSVHELKTALMAVKPEKFERLL